MKVCQIMLARGFGGAERIFVDYCICLKERGHDVLAIIDVKSDSKEELRKNNINFKEINILFRHNRFARKKAEKIIKKFSAEIIHVHLRRAMDFSYPVVKKTKIPLIASTHNYSKIKTYIKADHIIALTNDQRDFIVKEDIRFLKKISVLPNFSRFPAQKVKVKDKKNINFLSYGRFVHKKGFDVLLRAYKKMGLSNKETTLTIVGDGPLKESLVALVTELDLDNYVDIRPWTNSVVSLLDEHDIFVLPSRVEPFGIVLLEAMARGKLIISTKSEGPKQFINPEIGLLCEIDNVDSLANKMMYAAKNFYELQKLASRANNEYIESFHANSVLPKIESLYKKVIMKE